MVYINEASRQVIELHQAIIRREVPYRTVREQLALFAENLYTALQRGDPAAAVELSNYHPRWRGEAADTILHACCPPADCCLAIAREYGFPTWAEVEAEGNVVFNEVFEVAVDCLVGGDEASLRSLLDAHPSLVGLRSVYKHRAGLIHYVAANGVEIWRQCVPRNLPALTRLLIERGASPAMPSNIYGGTCSLLELMDTSEHPGTAGVKEELKTVIRSHRS